MLSILGLLTGLAGPLVSLAGRIADLQIAKVQAQTDIERNRINQQIEEAHDRKAILIAEAGNRIAGVINSSVRLLLTLGPASVLLKLFLWDKVIGSFNGCVGAQGNGPNCVTFNTDPLDAYQWAVITAVIAFYFGYNMIANRK